MKKIRIGTRGSKLALRQAAMVQEALHRMDSRIETQIIMLHTKGDRILDKPLVELGDKGVFVSEFEQALLADEIDLAVHSAKDLPMKLADGLCIAAVLPRGDVRDVLVIPKDGRLPTAFYGAREAESANGDDEERNGCRPVSFKNAVQPQPFFVVGSGSRRRRQQAASLWENIICKDIRGNVDTRLQKLKDSGKDANQLYKSSDCDANQETKGNQAVKYDGLILAKAGLDRLEVISRCENEFAFYPLAPELFLPAACQGIIAVEARRDSETAALCKKMSDADTELDFLVEREALAQLAADCSDTVAAWCRQEQGRLILDVMYGGNRQQAVRSIVQMEGKKESVEEVQCRKELQTGKWETLLEVGLDMARETAKSVKRMGNFEEG